jgi:hypothetical protein
MRYSFRLVLFSLLLLLLTSVPAFLLLWGTSCYGDTGGWGCDGETISVYPFETMVLIVFVSAGLAGTFTCWFCAVMGDEVPRNVVASVMLAGWLVFGYGVMTAVHSTWKGCPEGMVCKDSEASVPLTDEARAIQQREADQYDRELAESHPEMDKIYQANKAEEERRRWTKEDQQAVIDFERRRAAAAASEKP